MRTVTEGRRTDPVVEGLAESLPLPDDAWPEDGEQPVVRAVPHELLLRSYRRVLRALIARERPERVLDVGAGRSPQLSVEETEQLGVHYALLDISAEELEHAPSGFDRVVGDMGAEHVDVDEPYDFVFSKDLAEHVRDGSRFFANTFELLRPGGVAFHFFPTLYSLPLVVNKLLPGSLTEPLLMRMRPDRRLKFPAHYSWTRGPTDRQLARLESVGFDVVAYVGGFGHRYYEKVPPAQRMARHAWDFARRHELYDLTNYAYLIVRRP